MEKAAQDPDRKVTFVDLGKRSNKDRKCRCNQKEKPHEINAHHSFQCLVDCTTSPYGRCLEDRCPSHSKDKIGYILKECQI